MGHVFSDSETTAVLASEPPSSISEKGATNWRALRAVTQQVDAENINLRARVQTLEARLGDEPPASWSQTSKDQFQRVKKWGKAQEQRAADLQNTVDQLRAERCRDSEAYEQAFQRAAQRARRELRAFIHSEADWNALVSDAEAFFFGELDADSAAQMAFFAAAFKVAKYARPALTSQVRI